MSCEPAGSSKNAASWVSKAGCESTTPRSRSMAWSRLVSTPPQPRASPCRLTIKAWDRDPLTFGSDLIGFVEVNLECVLLRPALRRYRQFLAYQADIEKMDASTLRMMLEAKKVTNIPAGASRETLSSLLQSHSTGQSGTIMRWPEKSEDERLLGRQGMLP